MSQDPDYAFKLEKAIVSKYGEETVANPNSSWDEDKEKKYLEDLKNMAKIHNGILIYKKLFTLKEDKYCKVCDTYKPKLNNKVYFIKYDCCSACYYKYVDGRESRWLSGWRPQREELTCQ